MVTHGEGLIRKDSEVPLFDGQGSERTVTNGSQTVVGTLNLDGFGNQVGSTGSSSNPYMYAANSGYRNDGDAGLVHVGARYYDAQVGRFITRDTYLNQKPYLYCEHDPVNALDPSGHWGNWKELAGGLLWCLAAVAVVVTAPVWVAPVLIIGGGGLIWWGAMDEIHHYEHAIGELPINNGNNNGDRQGNGGRAGRPGRGDIYHLSDQFENEKAH